jgi:hypothetical protein
MLLIFYFGTIVNDYLFNNFCTSALALLRGGNARRV